MSGMRSADIMADRIAMAVLGGGGHCRHFLRSAITASAWDDYTHSQYGDLLLKLYGSGFDDRRALSFVNLFMYGGGFDMAAALAAKVLPFDLFETRRLIGRRGRPAWALRHLAARPPLGRGACGLMRAGAARRLPALLRPYVHEREGRALRDRDGGVAARRGARLRRLSQSQPPHDGAGRRCLGAAFGSRVLGRGGGRLISPPVYC